MAPTKEERSALAPAVASLDFYRHELIPESGVEHFRSLLADFPGSDEDRASYTYAKPRRPDRYPHAHWLRDKHICEAVALIAKHGFHESRTSRRSPRTSPATAACSMMHGSRCAKPPTFPMSATHDLRLTYASLLASAGMSLPIIGALLGRSQPATTARYAQHLLDDPLREATARAAAILSRETKTRGKPVQKGRV